MKHLFLICLSTLLLSVSACKKSGDHEDAGNTLNVGVGSDIPNIDPANSYDTVSSTIVYQVYEQLYEYEYLKRPYTLKPLLAEAMPTIENKGLRYIIKIKKNVLYHEDACFKGTPRTLTAKDFVTQIKRLAFAGSKSNGWWLFENKVKGLDKFRAEAGSDLKKLKELTVEGLSTPDDYTLVIDLTQRYPQLTYALAMSFTSPVPQEVVDCYENSLSGRAIGTGPFYLSSFVDNAGAELKKFKGYRPEFYPSTGDRLANDNDLLKDAGKPLPFLSNISYKVLKEDQPRWLNFMAKKIDFLLIPKDNYSSSITPSGDLSDDLKKRNVRLEISPTLTYWWFSFNMKDPLLGKNKNLRLAFAHAIDINRYISMFTNNVAQKANSIYPPGIPGYDPNKTLSVEHNQDKAKEYLAKAGYPNGKGLPTFVYDVRGASTTARQTAEFVKSELEKIGLKINISMNTFPGFLEKARQGNLQFWLDGWALDFPDAENILQLLISKNHAPGPNATFYSNKNFDQMYEELRFLPEGEQKMALMKKMEEQVLEDLPWVMLYYSRNYLLYHDYLKNFRHSELGHNYYKYLRLIKK